jgi:hypothetical protein
MWAELSLSPARNPDGAVEVLIAIITDVTSRKKTEAALQRVLDKASGGTALPPSSS